MNGTFEKEKMIGWRKMCSVEPHELYSPNFIRVIKSMTID